jgi:hypothetical protein
MLKDEGFACNSITVYSSKNQQELLGIHNYISQ